MPESQNTKSDDLGSKPEVSGSLAAATFCCHRNLHTLSHEYTCAQGCVQPGWDRAQNRP